MLIVEGLTGCTRGVNGGSPAMKLSDTNGTIRVFSAQEVEVSIAISNAFGTRDTNPMGYRGMDLSMAGQSYIGSNWHVTSGFVLFPLMGPIANVPLHGHGQVSVPYIACFNITTKALGGSSTSVTVRTVFAKVIDGKEMSIHGGWANHERNVPPVKVEEENVLNAVSNALVATSMAKKGNP